MADSGELMLSVVIPTYNEAQSIAKLLPLLSSRLVGVAHEIIVVDDDSPDNTGGAAQGAGGATVIVRKGERGLATAVTRGIDEARGNYVCVMDADLQHPPEMPRQLLDKAIATDAQLVIGTRHDLGGSAASFGKLRGLMSKVAGGVAWLAIPPIRRFKVTDPMSGLFLVRRDAINTKKMKPTGYKILLEILGRFHFDRVEEVGYQFGTRELGDSKLDAGTIRDYFGHMLRLAAIHPDNYRPVWFALVGSTGVGVNLGSLFVLHELLGWPLMLSAAVAVEISIVSNFLLNEVFTFNDLRHGSMFKRFLKFNSVTGLGLLINLAVFGLLTNVAGLYYILAQLIAIAVAFGFNYLVTLNWTYKRDLLTPKND